MTTSWRSIWSMATAWGGRSRPRAPNPPAPLPPPGPPQHHRRRRHGEDDDGGCGSRPQRRRILLNIPGSSSFRALATFQQQQRRRGGAGSPGRRRRNQRGGAGGRHSRWAAALGPAVDALVTSVHGGGATAAGGLAQLLQQSGWPWRAGVAAGDARRTTSRADCEPWNRRLSRCRCGGAAGRRRSSPPQRS
ncbi:hypothetical protein VPH35_124392 [Triticum aestivum]